MGLHAPVYDTLPDDLRMFEATREESQRLLDVYLDRRQLWQPSTLEDVHGTGERFSEHYGFMEIGKGELSVSMPLAACLEVTYITESGIPWYTGDVNDIFNPMHTDPDSGDPHAIIGAYWPADELVHTIGAHRILGLTIPKRLEKVELDSRQFVKSSKVPKPADSAHGLAYTALQERLTNVTYRNLCRALKVVEVEEVRAGHEAGAMIVRFAREFYKHVGADERLHETLIAGTLRAALDSGDKAVTTHALRAINDVYVDTDFVMPGENMPNYLRRAALVNKMGVLTVAHQQQGMHHFVMDKWRIPELTGLSPEGQELQDKITSHVAALPYATAA